MSDGVLRGVALMQRVRSASERTRRRRLNGAVGSAVPAGRRALGAARPASGPSGWRIVGIAVLWLALLIWPAPQLGRFLAAQAPRLAGPTIHDASVWASHTLARIPDRIHAIASPNEPHTYWQVGLTTGDEDAHSTGFRAAMVTLVPQRVSPDTSNYYWTGSYLADGSFVQVGYYVPSHDPMHAGWFYCSFYKDGKEGPCKYGPPDSAGQTGESHTFTLASSPAQGGDYTWRATMDDTALGEFQWAAGESGNNTPVIYAESSGYKPHGADSILGPVDFPGGLQVRHADATTYAAARHLFAAYNAPNVCPPYGIAKDGHGGVLLGSGLKCPDNWSEFS